MQIYQETYVGSATTVNELIIILKENVPKDASIDIASLEYTANVEVWYDRDTNTVILK